MRIEDIAKIAHQTNKAYCEVNEDYTQSNWEDCPSWQKESAIKGIEFIMSNPLATSEEVHQSWMEEKFANGWTYGVIKDPEAKFHPCLVDYRDLPVRERVKDLLFRQTVVTLLPLLD